MFVLFQVGLIESIAICHKTLQEFFVSAFVEGNKHLRHILHLCEV